MHVADTAGSSRNVDDLLTSFSLSFTIRVRLFLFDSRFRIQIKMNVDAWKMSLNEHVFFPFFSWLISEFIHCWKCIAQMAIVNMLTDRISDFLRAVFFFMPNAVDCWTRLVVSLWLSIPPSFIPFTSNVDPVSEKIIFQYQPFITWW